MTDYNKMTTEHLIDANGEDKALIADAQQRISNREAILKLRIGEGSKDSGLYYDASRLTFDTPVKDYKTICERLEVSRQMYAAHTKKVHKDFFKYTARIIKK